MAEESPLKSTSSYFAEGISGYDFVKKVFESHHDEVIETLLKYAGNDECDFLEFKAGIEAKPNTLKPGEKQEDLYWNYAKEIIAMINSRGGLFVLGVSDERDHHVVPLETNDSGNVISTKGLESYIREVIDLRLLPKGKSWKYKGNKFTVEEDLDPYIEHKKIRYKGHFIFGYLVKPREDGEFIYVQSNKNGVQTPEIVFARRKGEIGEAKEYIGHKSIAAYQRERQIRSTILAADVQKFELGNSPGSSGAYRLKQLKEGSEDAESKRLLQLTLGAKLVSTFEPGDRIAGYEILAKIGSGGMGSVYRVRKPMQQQTFALKAFTPPQGAADLEPMKKRFITEAQMLGTLKHAYIPRLYDINFDTPTRCLFFVMDLIESDTKGECHSLSDYTIATRDPEKKIPVSDEQAICWLQELCEIVGYLHALGVVHRDIKLSNVMIGKDKHVYLTDFGIVKVSDETLQKKVGYEVTLTYTQGYNASKPQIGTMAYLAPEVRHKESKASSKSDVWAIGITFFKLVSGQWFEGQQLNKSNWCVRHDLWFPLLSTMLEYEPADRSSCDDVLDIIKIQRCLRQQMPADETRQFNTQLKIILDRPPTESMIIAGGAGIGKTTIALHKALQIRSIHGDVLFLSKFTALKKQFQDKCQGTSLAKRIQTFAEWEKSGRTEADMLIITGAQDFTYDEIERLISSTQKSIIFIGDDTQTILEEITRVSLEDIAGLVGVPVTRLTLPNCSSPANADNNSPLATVQTPPASAHTRGHWRIYVVLILALLLSFTCILGIINLSHAGHSPLSRPQRPTANYGTPAPKHDPPYASGTETNPQWRTDEAINMGRSESPTNHSEFTSDDVVMGQNVSRPNGSDLISCHMDHAAGTVKNFEIAQGVLIEMVWCPPGVYEMGSPTTEPGRSDDELPHKVRLTSGFWIGKYPITQAQWQGVMGSNPSFFKGDNLPVERVSWNDCQKFLHRVNQTSESEMVLPTEAQWEYACRAGCRAAYPWGTALLNGDKANCDGTHPNGGTRAAPGRYLKRTTAVGSYPPNAWGIFDMTGNVYEWCSDWYGEYGMSAAEDPKGAKWGAAKVLRGGNWDNAARLCRSAARIFNTPDFTSSRCGLRLVTIDQ